MTGVAITILVKKPKASDEAARIYYHDIGDYLSREEKLRIIRNMGDISNPLMQWVTITPNEHGDWLNKRSEQFKLYTPLGDKIDKKNKKTFFVPYYSNGLKTQRDPWCYNSSLPVVEKSAKEQIDFYNEQREKLAKKEISDVDYSTHKISWTRAVLSDIQRNKPYNTQDCQFREGLYRPFSNSTCYFIGL